MIHVISRTLCYQIERSWIVALLQLMAATLQLLKVGNCAAKLLPRASEAAQHFCIPLQLELSCCLASKMLLNSFNLAVPLFWSDFVALYSAASVVRVCSPPREGGVQILTVMVQKTTRSLMPQRAPTTWVSLARLPLYLSTINKFCMLTNLWTYAGLLCSCSRLDDISATVHNTRL